MLTVWVVVAVLSFGGQEAKVRMPDAQVYASRGLCEFDGLPSLAADAKASCEPFIIRQTK